MPEKQIVISKEKQVKKKCSVCDKVLKKENKVIPKLEHKYENNICKNCGRINNAQLDTTYTSKTTNSYPFQVIQFKTPENGKYKFHCEKYYSLGFHMAIYLKKKTLMTRL